MTTMDYIALNNEGAANLINGDYAHSIPKLGIVLKDLSEKSAITKSFSSQGLRPKNDADRPDTPSKTPALTFEPLPDLQSSSYFFLHDYTAIVSSDVNMRGAHCRHQLSAIVAYNMAVGVHRMGIVHGDANVISKAFKFYQMSQALLITTMKNEADSSFYQLFTAILNNMGYLLYERGDYKACRRCFDQILKVSQFHSSTSSSRMLKSAGSTQGGINHQAEFTLNALAMQYPMDTARAA